MSTHHFGGGIGRDASKQTNHNLICVRMRVVRSLSLSFFFSTYSIWSRLRYPQCESWWWRLSPNVLYMFVHFNILQIVLCMFKFLLDLFFLSLSLARSLSSLLLLFLCTSKFKNENGDEEGARAHTHLRAM